MELQKVINAFSDKAQKNIFNNEIYNNYQQMAKWLKELAAYKKEFGDLNKINERDNTLFCIAGYYGYDAQSQVAIEECSELIKAIIQYNRMRDGEMENYKRLNQTDGIINLTEEIADVEIILLQIISLTRIEDNVKAMMAKKIHQQNTKMKEEMYNKGD